MGQSICGRGDSGDQAIAQKSPPPFSRVGMLDPKLKTGTIFPPYLRILLKKMEVLPIGEERYSLVGGVGGERLPAFSNFVCHQQF